jgi:hypothetical protein
MTGRKWNMRRFVFIGLAFLVVLSLSAPVFAWEFSMKGETEWRYRYWTRTGNQDIFGTMSDSVNLGINHLQTFPTTATTNRGSGTFGVLAGENRFGADMQLTDYRMTIFPKINVNPAIEITASVNLTSLGIWSDGEPLIGNGTVAVPAPRDPGYVNSLYVPIQDRPVAVNVPNTYLTLQWLKTSVRTPMLDFSIGYKASLLGIGLWKHECNRPSASFEISARFGPLKVGLEPYFGRNQSSWALGTSRSRIEGQGAAERQTDRRNYFRAIEGYIEYANGPFYFVLASDSYTQPSAPIPDQRGTAINATATPEADVIRYRQTAAMKYFNGRYFFNAEIDWFTRWSSGRGIGQTTALVNQNDDNDAFLYGLETGLLCGPAKLTVNYVRATGDDPSTRITTEDAASSEAGLSACYMKDWGYLMYYMYGTGDGWDAAGYGQPTNLNHLGARLDYAIASNLNVFAVYAYAWRGNPTAYRLGGNYQLGLQAWTNEDIRLSQLGQFQGHAVPDSAREIGWEVDLGINWKLLENLTWDSTLAYWKPGTWWPFAYPNSAHLYVLGIVPNANPNSPAGEAAAIFGVGREINALFSVESRLLVTF